MRYLVQTKAFRRDLKREVKGKYSKLLPEVLKEVIDILSNDGLLPYFYHDHALKGNWLGCRECHLFFDLVLVYRYEGNDKLVFEKIGSHSEALGM